MKEITTGKAVIDTGVFSRELLEKICREIKQKTEITTNPKQDKSA